MKNDPKSGKSWSRGNVQRTDDVVAGLREMLRTAVENRRRFQRPPHRNLRAEREWAEIVEMISSTIAKLEKGKRNGS